MITVATLDTNTPSVQYLSNKDKRLAKLFTMVGPIVYKCPTDLYSFLIGQIVNQMLSNKASDAITSRLIDLCGGIISVSAIKQLSDSQIKSVGLSRYKVEYIRALTSAIEEGNINLDSLCSMKNDEVISVLTKVRGMGVWSAKMFLLFALDRQDILPFEDVAFLQGYKWLYKTDDISPESIKKRCSKWVPYQSIAARYLYRALDEGLTKEVFHLYK